MTADRFHGTLPAVLIDSINKSFFHSRMLRAWGHAKAMESNDHWMLQMRQTSSLVEAMVACGIRLDDKPASDLVIGRDSMTVLAADAAQAEHCAATASAAARTLSNGAMQSLMNEIARCTPCDFGRGAGHGDGAKVADAARVSRIVSEPGSRATTGCLFSVVRKS